MSYGVVVGSLVLGSVIISGPGLIVLVIPERYASAALAVLFIGLFVAQSLYVRYLIWMGHDLDSFGHAIVRTLKHCSFWVLGAGMFVRILVEAAFYWRRAMRRRAVVHSAQEPSDLADVQPLVTRAPAC